VLHGSELRTGRAGFRHRLYLFQEDGIHFACLLLGLVPSSGFREDVTSDGRRLAFSLGPIVPSSRHEHGQHDPDAKALTSHCLASLDASSWKGRLSSEQKLQRELNLARWKRGLDLAERGRADVVVRQPEVHPVQEIEKLPPKLHGLGFGQTEIL
jgi:hypothetical protein